MGTLVSSTKIIKHTLLLTLAGYSIFLLLQSQAVPLLQSLNNILSDTPLFQLPYFSETTAALSILLLLKPMIGYGLSYEKYIARTPKFFSHELDSILLCAFITLTIGLSVNNISIFTTLLPPPAYTLELTALSLVYYLYLGRPKPFKIYTIFRIFPFITAAFIWIQYTHGVYAELSGELKACLLLYFSVAVFYTFPYHLFVALTSGGIHFISMSVFIGKKIRENCNDNKSLMTAVRDEVAEFNPLSLWFKRNQEQRIDFNNLSIVQAITAHAEGFNTQDKLHRLFRGLPYDNGKSVPSVITDDTNQNVPDILDRSQYIDELYSIITGHFNDPLAKPVTIALYGEWGEGKSFIVESLISKVSRQNTNIICSKIELWKLFIPEQQKNITEGFFQHLLIDLSSHIRSLAFKSRIKQLSHSLQGNVTLTDKISHGLLTLTIFPWGNNSPEQLLENIEKELSQHDKKLLIILEDLDRLEPDELIKSIRLLRSIQSIASGAIFLFVCDQSKLEELCRKKGLGPDYLQKFIQYETHLPPYSYEQIKAYIKREMSDYWHTQHLINKETVASAIDDVFQHEDVQELVKNMRHARRLIGGLKKSYAASVSEICMQDCIELEILRQNAPFIYRHIQENPDIYLAKHIESYLVPDSDEKIRDENNEKLLRLITTENYSIKKQKSIAGIIQRIFPKTHNDKNYSPYSNREKLNYRLQEPMFFHRYFYKRTPDTEVQNAEIIELIENTQTQTESEAITLLSTKIEQYYKKNRLEHFSGLIFTVFNKTQISRNFYKRLSMAAINLLKRQDLQHGVNYEIFRLLRKSIPLCSKPEATTIIETACTNLDLPTACKLYETSTDKSETPSGAKILMNRFEDKYKDEKNDFFSLSKDDRDACWRTLLSYGSNIQKQCAGIQKSATLSKDHAEKFIMLFTDVDKFASNLILAYFKDSKSFDLSSLNSDVAEVLAPLQKAIENAKSK